MAYVFTKQKTNKDKNLNEDGRGTRFTKSIEHVYLSCFQTEDKNTQE